MAKKSGTKNAHQQKAAGIDWKEVQKTVTQQRARFPEMVAGVVGSYAVDGLNSEKKFVVLNFEVKPRWFEPQGDKPGQHILVIEEKMSYGGTEMPIFVFHTWLKKRIKNISFARGTIGEVQRAMLQFLQKNLTKEIDTARSATTDIHSMAAVDTAHAAELGSADSVPAPVADVDVRSMANVDEEHQVLELET